MIYRQGVKRASQGKKNNAIDDRYFKIVEKTLYLELGHASQKNEREIDMLVRSVMSKEQT